MALSKLARSLGTSSTIHSPPMPFFFFFFHLSFFVVVVVFVLKWRLARAH